MNIQEEVEKYVSKVILREFDLHGSYRDVEFFSIAKRLFINGAKQETAEMSWTQRTESIFDQDFLLMHKDVVAEISAFRESLELREFTEKSTLGVSGNRKNSL